MSTITDVRTTTQTISGVENTLEVAADGIVIVKDAGHGIQDNGTNSTIIVDGFVRAVKNGGLVSGIYSDKTPEITIGKTGCVQGERYAIEVQGSTVVVDNAGELDSLGANHAGVYARYNLDLKNTGTITADFGVSLNSGKIENHGTIRASSIGISVLPEDLGLGIEIINTGRIISWFAAVAGSSRGEDITNTGRIVGNLDLRYGNDVVDTRGGTIKGQILGGPGQDTLITDNAKIKLTELSTNADYDTVKSTVSYTLNANVERLSLIGNKDIDGTGTDGEDYLYGNDGDNVLNAKNGFNEIYGFGGTDMLIGGTGQDFFGFAKGWGKDTVKNFTHGQDDIDIYGLGVDSYKDLKSHIEKHGDDTWIDFGKDVLIVQDVAPTELDANDFAFNVHW